MSEFSKEKKVPKLDRRDFLRLLGATGVGLAFAPFVSFGNYMPNPVRHTLGKVPLMITKGDVEVHANIFDIKINSAEVITYPATGDKALDTEPFRKWQFIRLPGELGGKTNDVSAFRVFSMICLHLWCLWGYKGNDESSPRNQLECPCHGSMYDLTDGKAFAGPASTQSEPSNVLPFLELESDEKGFLFIIEPKFTANENGIIGYGRFLK